MTTPKDAHKTSNLSVPGLHRANTVAPTSRPMTPRSAVSSTRRKTHRFTSLFDRHRAREPEFEMLTPPSSTAPPSPPPTISKLGKAFVDSLNVRQLSDFLTWMLYYDVVELPDSPTAWYEPITKMEMRGWVALGDSLSKSSQAMDTGYGFELVVFDSICDRLNLQRSTVHALLMQFADPEKMAYSQISTVVNNCLDESLATVETFEAVKMKLQELDKLASHLKPTEDSVYDDWHAIIVKRIRGLLTSVVEPRIANLRSGTPLITAATSEQLPKEVKDGIKMNFAYEAMQPKRQVPLSRYEIFSEVTVTPYGTPSISLPEGQGDDEAERARRHAVRLMEENHALRAQVAELKKDKEGLQESNDKLACRIAKLGRMQLQGYVRSQVDGVFISTSESTSPTPPVPQDRTRPRSLSTDAGLKLASQLDQQMNLTDTHKRTRSEEVSSRYEDVFSGLDTPPSPPIRLSDPATGNLLENSNTRHPSRVAVDAVGTGRRSGMVFTAGQKNLLAAIRGATPEVSEEEDEGGDGMGTPTPAARK